MMTFGSPQTSQIVLLQQHRPHVRCERGVVIEDGHDPVVVLVIRRTLRLSLLVDQLQQVGAPDHGQTSPRRTGASPRQVQLSFVHERSIQANAGIQFDQLVQSIGGTRGSEQLTGGAVIE